MFKRMMQKKFVVSKKRKGFSFMEVLLALVLIVAMSVGAFFALNTAQQTRKMAQMNNDMDAIVNAVLTYEALNISGELPATLSACTTGLTAANSIDGSDHKNILKWTKGTTAVNGDGGSVEDGTFKNPWNTAYTYDKDKRTLKTTPKDANGSNLNEVVRYF